ncbi:MAG: hypothetical protein JRE12_10320, partial [Deltaproteobacteria bacterium]|nr:hypothetical protein [Deltaproteobacteria bacterium]
MRKFTYFMFVIVCATMLLAGCASMSKKFTAQQKANMGIFADQTITMLSEADFGFGRDEAVYVREFLDGNIEGDLDLQRSLKEAGWFFGEIVEYSVGLVTIVETKQGEAARVAGYKEFMSGFNAEMLDKLEMAPDHYTSTLEEIGQQEEFLGALQKGQPIINAAARYMHRVLDQMEVDIDIVVKNLETSIDAEYNEVILYQEALEEEKYTILRSIGLLYLAYKGESDAFDRLVAENSIRRKELLPDGNPTIDELEAIGEHLRIRLDAIHLIEQEIRPDWENYRETHKELDKLHDKAITQNRHARLITLVWLRAHQKMASGVSSP